MEVGERLKFIRELKGISQRELAKRAGVTNSTISMIEKNGVSPSVSSLMKVLSGIPISIGDFFTLDFDRLVPDPIIYRAGEQPDISNSDVCQKLLGVDLPNRTMNMVWETYPPGADTGEEMLCHDGEKTGFIVSGEVELTVGLDVYNLKAGDGYYFNSDNPHRFRNPTKSACDIVCVSSNDQHL